MYSESFCSFVEQKCVICTAKIDTEPVLEISQIFSIYLSRLSVAELKQLVSRPDVVEMHDVTARDPRLLVHLKSTRNIFIYKIAKKSSVDFNTFKHLSTLTISQETKFTKSWIKSFHPRANRFCVIFLFGTHFLFVKNQSRARFTTVHKSFF